MLILTNCLTDTPDEGCVKVANSLTWRLKQRSPETTTVVTYERRPARSDIHLKLGKLLVAPSLIKLLRKRREPVIYIPFPARLLPTAVRIFLLSLFARNGIKTVLVMRQGSAGWLAKLLLRLSHSEIVALSREAFELYNGIVGNRASYLRCGVDTEKYTPVDESTKAALRQKYDIPVDKTVVTHVGHLSQGRNIRTLLNVSAEHQVLLVVSTLTESQRDPQLRAELEARPNIRIIDTYLENIEEIYQLSDVYLFPVVSSGHCIDVPLSAMEAAACGIPVIATEYGELKELGGVKGFWFTDIFEPDKLNALIAEVVNSGVDGHVHIKQYDWNMALDALSTFA